LWDTAAVCQHAGTCNISESSSCCKEFCLLHCFVTVIITTHDEMIKFGMGNTLLTFVDKYYEYGGDLDIEDRGLTIG
jgi:hypothetical protein